MCSSAIIIDIVIDECQSIHTKSELSRGRHLQLELEEAYLLSVRPLAEDDFVCNVAACEHAAPLRGVCLEALLNQRVRSTAVLCPTLSRCVSNDHVISQIQAWSTGERESGTGGKQCKCFLGNSLPAVCDSHRSTSTRTVELALHCFFS
ncbi:hypothetical protein Bpfe_006920, partial [Biomphalaria pfeifferi]